MSTTTTTSTTTTPPSSILSDYALHHSGSEFSSDQTPPAAHTNPPTWPTNHRRVPPYRPVNRQQDRSERPAGSNPAEFVFIQAMLHGVWLNASVARLWRFTGGRVNDKVFHYEVGGEW
ncbi:hypothetical protein P170DRAFT_479076 [Aspergillus steynii IBT 23096]|uniref:Uncharacterized protein n=1 Tax=Aspergillus steynii IBT 23096 TaxID=1392250 RepID=A0A2I2FZU2_9EURO|nr:uncharacterized protein P170DRAFT_479076 [Aspergillus steynii IBT 23096]PLB46155.1 hypothetical protein P170DRAFT_479076 [Aspergillus steynii IBT 23096]